jgi:hypothetical protein
MLRLCRLAALAGAFMLWFPTQSTADLVCKPILTFKEASFSPAQEQQRKWTATLHVDASRCATTSGYFDVKFVRQKEFGPDLLFTQRFIWTPGLLKVSLEFWWDEAVQDFWIGNTRPCPCAT